MKISLNLFLWLSTPYFLKNKLRVIFLKDKSHRPIFDTLPQTTIKENETRTEWSNIIVVTHW